jgi:hypothetical protein
VGGDGGVDVDADGRVAATATVSTVAGVVTGGMILGATIAGVDASRAAGAAVVGLGPGEGVAAMDVVGFAGRLTR